MALALGSGSVSSSIVSALFAPGSLPASIVARYSGAQFGIICSTATSRLHRVLRGASAYAGKQCAPALASCVHPLLFKHNHAGATSLAPGPAHDRRDWHPELTNSKLDALHPLIPELTIKPSFDDASLKLF